MKTAIKENPPIACLPNKTIDEKIEMLSNAFYKANIDNIVNRQKITVEICITNGVKIGKEKSIYYIDGGRPTIFIELFGHYETKYNKIKHSLEKVGLMDNVDFSICKNKIGFKAIKTL